MNKIHHFLLLLSVATATVRAQQGAGEYPDVISDRKIPVRSADASGNQWGEDAEKSIDGNMHTLYHSPWNDTKFPVTVNYHFKDVDLLDYFIYYPRSDGGSNGNFMEMEVWVSTASKPEFVRIGKYDFEGKGSPSKINFPGGIKSPETVRIIVNSGMGDGNGSYASCAEMMFYAKSGQSSIPELFTDETCSELRPGIGKQHINKVKNAFFRRLATSLLDKTYPKEFRIQQYKPYPNPETAARKNKASTYSLLDNPTGICITENDRELIVFAGKMGKDLISLRLIDFEKGWSGVDFLLNEGVNRFNFELNSKGLLYVMYHTSDPAAKPVKIHIATGTVNGYYDITKHTASDWNRLIDNAKGHDFDVLGKYSHLTYPVSSLKEYCPDISRLVQVYDSISWLEQQFIGLYKYNRANLNRMYFHVDYNMPGGWGAYATSYRTAYPQYSMPALCNAGKLRSTDIWGPAHEVGHVNQTRPGFRWGGMIEVSNNVYSMYVQYSFGNRSRLIDEGDAGYRSRYEKGFTEMLAARALHSTYEDVFCKLIPFWQLELYCSHVQGKTDFYADVHEQVRLLPDPRNDGEAQLQFIKICCDAAREDLTDFFKAWGMLTPVDYSGNYSGYGSGNLTLTCTPEQIDEIVRYAKKYPRPAVNVQYIHDDCVDIYRNSAKIVEGAAERNGNTVKLDGWKNVAVFEVYDGEKPVLITPHAEFSIPSSAKDPVIYAVSAKGDRVKAEGQPALRPENSASTPLSPEQMRKDIDFFFETMAKVHANMYAFVGKDEMAKIRERLYKDCSTPMQTIDFNIRMCRLNSLFDGHTSIYFNFWQALNESNGFFPSPVSFKGGEIYLHEADDRPGQRILSINGTDIKDIYSRMVNTHEIKEAGEIRAGLSFAGNLLINTDVRSPFRVVVEGNKGILLDGVAPKDIKTLKSGFSNQTGLGFRMYPEKSIAIIDYNTCSFSRDPDTQQKLNRWFDTRFRQIADRKIKNLFIDISRNGGGNSDNNNVLFNRIKHDDTIELVYMTQRRYRYLPDGRSEALDHLKSDTFRLATPPNPKGFDGNIYLIQGPGSYSAAIGVAEWFEKLNRAKLIGEQTGQATAVYIDHMGGFKMPESGISFGSSYKYWKSLPAGREDRGVQPDYPVKLDYSKSYYELNDLLGFMAQIDPKFNYTPEAPPRGTKVAVKSASASCFQDGEDIDKALDGDLNTLYHSPYYESAAFPVILTFHFDGIRQIDFLKYYPRVNDPPNGPFGEVEIWAGTQSDPTLRKIGVHDFYRASTPGYYQFPKPLKNPAKIELRVLSSIGWYEVDHVSCAEMEFYTSSDQ
jgi:hypothetical protein